MPSIASTLTSQVDGLLKVYKYNKYVYFEFADEKQLKQAKEKVIQLWDRNDCPFLRFGSQKKTAAQPDLLFSYPKKARFSFGVSTKPTATGESVGSTEELIERVAGIMASGISNKTVPIEKIKNPEELLYKGIFNL